MGSLTYCSLTVVSGLSVDLGLDDKTEDWLIAPFQLADFIDV